MFVVGLISSYKEGRLVQGALRSLAPHCDAVYVLEAPIGQHREGPESVFGKTAEHVVVQRSGRPRASDAAKRTEMIRWACTKFPTRPLWGVWIDGDELLVNGEHLDAMLEWVVHESELTGETGYKCPLRLVEWDSSVALCHGHVVRIDLIEEYLYSLALASMPAVSAQPVPLGNEAIWKPGTIAEDGSGIESYPSVPTAFMRGPLQGEPHILHRSLLRPSSRTVERQHEAEARERERITGVGS